MSVKSFTLWFYLQTIFGNHTWRERARAHSSHSPKPISKLTSAKLQLAQPRSCCPTIQNPSPRVPLNHFQKKKEPNQEREREAGHRQRVRESRPSSERERGQSLELEIDSTAIWAVPLTTNLPYFSLPPSATHVTDLPFSLYACWANHRKTSNPLWPSRLCCAILPPPPLDWTQSPLSLSLSLSLSLPSSLNLIGFDDFFFVGFCFFCVYLLRNDIIYLFGSWENVSNK